MTFLFRGLKREKRTPIERETTNTHTFRYTGQKFTSEAKHNTGARCLYKSPPLLVQRTSCLHGPQAGAFEKVVHAWSSNFKIARHRKVDGEYRLACPVYYLVIYHRPRLSTFVSMCRLLAGALLASPESAEQTGHADTPPQPCECGASPRSW